MNESNTSRLIAGALYDLIGFLTTRDTEVTMSAHHTVHDALDALKEFAEKRNLSLDNPYIEDWQDSLATDEDVAWAENECCPCDKCKIHLTRLLASVDAARRGQEDTARLVWLERWPDLHRVTEIHSVVDGFTIDFTDHDDAVCVASYQGSTLREAIDAARAAQPEGR